MACARYTDIFQQLIVYLRQQINVDVICLKGIGILGETDRLQPFADLAHVASCSSNAFASFRSRVSNPSVNQPQTGANNSRACRTLPWSRQRRARLMEARSLERIEWPSFRASRLNKSGAFALVDCSRHRLAEYFP